MDETKLSIQDIQHIMGWSYPTALKWAQAHGEKVDTGIADGKWFVPAGKLATVVAVKVNQADIIKRRFNSYTNGQ